MSDAPFRILPLITDRNRPFWTAGRDGVMRFQRCQSCGYWLHPHGVRCPKCLSKDLAYEAVSGKATVYTFTINEQGWMPVPELPLPELPLPLAEADPLPGLPPTP